MRSLFERLNELIHCHAHASTFFDNPQSDLIKEQLVDCVSNLSLKFPNRILTITSREEMALLVQIAQSNTTVALNKLTAYQEEMPDECYELVEQYLMNFMYFLYTSHYLYFDATATMPEAFWSQEQGMMTGTIACLKKLECIDPALPALLQKEFLENTQDGPLSYNATNYWHNLCHKLQENLAKDMRDEVFIRTLITCNFNSAPFIQYVSQKSETEPNGEAFRNYLFRTAETNDLALYEKRASCKDQLMTCILQDPVDNGTTTPSEKLEINLSVAQIGTLIWLLVQVGIFRTKNISELIRIIAANIRTPKTANISAESLYKHFYTRQTAANSILHTILRNMQNHLHSVISFALLFFDEVSSAFLATPYQESYLALI